MGVVIGGKKSNEGGVSHCLLLRGFLRHVEGMRARPLRRPPAPMAMRPPPLFIGRPPPMHAPRAPIARAAWHVCARCAVCTMLTAWLHSLPLARRAVVPFLPTDLACDLLPWGCPITNAPTCAPDPLLPWAACLLHKVRLLSLPIRSNVFDCWQLYTLLLVCVTIVLRKVHSMNRPLIPFFQVCRCAAISSSSSNGMMARHLALMPTQACASPCLQVNTPPFGGCTLHV